MAKYTKEELLKRAAPYFSQGEKLMYATSDGNIFYANHKNFAVSHKGTIKGELFELTKEDFYKLGLAKEETAPVVEEAEKKKPGRKPNNVNDGTE